MMRDTGDHSPVRQQTTPSPETIIRNLDDFVGKWKDVDKDGWKILPSQALAEILKLKVHVRKGCFSDISTGCGTNRNEAFHKHLNSILSKNRLGVLLAYALVFTAVYSHNSNLKCKGKRIVRPISAAVASGMSEMLDEPQVVHEQIGIPRALLNESCDTSMHISTSSLHELNESDEVLHSDVYISILECASSVYALTKSLWKHMGHNANRKWLYLQYVQKVEHVSCGSGQRGTWQDHENNIEEILSDWMFQRVRVDSSNGVGDCFFQSIVMNIMERPEISQLVKIQGENMLEIVQDLRSKLVMEWLGENREYYTEFLLLPEQVEQSKEQLYEAMASKFLQMGFYSSDTGDIMPLGLSNALGLPILITFGIM